MDNRDSLDNTNYNNPSIWESKYDDDGFTSFLKWVGAFAIIIFLLWGIFIYTNPINNITVEVINESITSEEDEKYDNDSYGDYYEEEDYYYDDYPNTEGYHWGHMPITYYIENEETCGVTTIKQIHQSFEIIESETGGVVNFEEEFNDSDIIIKCFDRYDESVKELASGRTFADSLMWTYIDETNMTISQGEVRLFKVRKLSHYGRCKKYPVTILHEILHLFDFGHTKSGIMYKYVGMCPTGDDEEIIDDYIIEKLKETYTIEERELY